jgi:hypothetical protein
MKYFNKCAKIEYQNKLTTKKRKRKLNVTLSLFIFIYICVDKIVFILKSDKNNYFNCLVK